MKKKQKSDHAINNELEKAKLSDFDLKNTTVVNEKWNLEKSYPLNIRIKKGILAEVKAIAREKGVPYQTLLKIYIADGVRHDKNILTGS